jgi:hypothetical protein
LYFFYFAAEVLVAPFKGVFHFRAALFLAGVIGVSTVPAVFTDKLWVNLFGEVFLPDATFGLIALLIIFRFFVNGLVGFGVEYFLLFLMFGFGEV